MSFIIGEYSLYDYNQIVSPGSGTHITLKLTNNTRNTLPTIEGDNITVEVINIEKNNSPYGQVKANKVWGLYIDTYSTDDDLTAHNDTIITITNSNLAIGQTYTFNMPIMSINNTTYVYNYNLRSNTHYNRNGVFPEETLYPYANISCELSLDYKPTVTTSPLVINNAYNGYAVAGVSTVKTTGTIGHYIPSDTAELTPYGHSSVSNSIDLFIESGNEYTYLTSKLKNNSNNYSGTVGVYVTDSRGRVAYDYKTINVKGYHLPSLVINTSGENTYVSRCDSSGNADGLGEYGKLHLVWEVSAIDSNDPNSLQSAVVVLNEETTLNPTSGSIALGYLEYIFPLATDENGYLSITLTDKIKTNTITSMVVPKASMPLSLYDDGIDIGISFGAMATESGAWMYMPFYLKSIESNKMFQICVDDDGRLFTQSIGPSPYLGNFWNMSETGYINTMTYQTQTAVAGEQIIFDVKTGTLAIPIYALAPTSTITYDSKQIYMLRKITSSRSYDSSTQTTTFTIESTNSSSILQVGNKYLITCYGSLNTTSPECTISLKSGQKLIRYYMSYMPAITESEIVAEGPGEVTYKPYDTITGTSYNSITYLATQYNNSNDFAYVPAEKNKTGFNIGMGTPQTATIDGTTYSLHRIEELYSVIDVQNEVIEIETGTR